MSNHLAHEASLYLRQHAENPVDWYPWGEEAFEKAKREHKPIFLSIGYASCHWCHVMAKESFENEAVARVLNRGFVSVKVDREERPDVDAVYMEACMALNGSGGWPLTVLMTPEGKPFFAGTYLPRENRGRQLGLIPLLQAVEGKWSRDRAGLEKTAGELSAFLTKDSAAGETAIDPELPKRAYEQLKAGFDEEYGGYLTCFDADGKYTGNGTKYIVTQSRMVWGFSNLREFARSQDLERVEHAARQGAEFLMNAFWDDKYQGYYWQLNRDGSIADPSKLIYGEGFAIYALSEFARVYGDERATAFAEKGFDLLQKYAADTLRGGYYENIERDWSISPAGPSAGDRKSLDIHMHLLEAFTTLYLLTGSEVHGRKLKEVLDLIFRHMINCEKGYGYNQFDLEFNQIPAININRTWNAERETNEVIATPTDTTSYGHNVELSWLADLALDALGCAQQAVWRQSGMDADNGVDKGVLRLEAPRLGIEESRLSHYGASLLCYQCCQGRYDNTARTPQSIGAGTSSQRQRDYNRTSGAAFRGQLLYSPRQFLL